MCFLFLLPVLLEVSVLVLSSAQNTYYVKPANSSPPEACQGKLCLTFDQYLEEKDSYFRTNSAFLFLGGIHSMQVSITVSEVSDLSLKGIGNNSSIIKCAQGVVLQIKNVVYFSIDGLTFVFHNDHQPKLLIIGSDGLIISNSKFQGNETEDVAGTVQAISVSYSGMAIINCTFEGIHGGAIILHEEVRLTLEGSTFTENSAPKGGALFCASSSMILSGNVFSRNEATAAGGAVFSAACTVTMISGVNVFTENKCMNDGGTMKFIDGTLSIKSTTYFQSNKADKGGALYLLNSKTTLAEANITFISNAAGSAGGAIFAITSLRFTDNYVLISATEFLYNKARQGGSVYVFGEKNVTIHKSVYENNSAEFGGVVYALNASLVLSSSNFSRNTAQKGGALYSSATRIVIKDTVTFYFNSAQNGGAMFFTFGSVLSFGEFYFSTIVSTYNGASLGGSIYHDDTVTPMQCNYIGGTTDDATKLPNCFIRSSGFSPRIYSYYDRATVDGSFIYGGLFDKCLPYALITLKDQFEIESQNDSARPVGSLPYQLCLCKRNNYNCVSRKNITVHRGQTFQLQLMALGLWHLATATTVIALTSNSSRLALSQASQKLPQHCSSLTYTLYSTKDKEQLVLYPDGPCRDTGAVKISIDATLLPCPDAFIEQDGGCVCEERLKAYDANCTIAERIFVTRKSGLRFWMGMEYNNGSYKGLILYKSCPFEYCRTGTVEIDLDNLNSQCDFNRSGLLCGACQVNHSLMLGNPRCKPCSNYFLTLLIPFSIAGIALVIFLTLLRLTVATGMINGVILYANIVQVNRRLFFPANATNILTVFIAWVNLDLGFETCFFDGLDAYGQTWLQFVFPLYIWILISMIILSSRYSITVSKIIGSNPVAVLATLLLMSYAKIFKIIIDVFSSVNLDYPNGQKVTVWLKDATLPYLRSKHLVLTVLTSLIFIFIFLPYTLLLLVNTHLYRFSRTKHLHWFIHRIKPLIDAYTGPYKSNTRFWTGLLLLVRCVMYIIFSVNSLGGSNHSLFAIIIIFTGIGLLAAYIQIYDRLFNLILEELVYFSLVILSAGTLAGFNKAALSYSLVGFVFVSMLMIAAYQFYNVYIVKSRAWLKVTALFKKDPKKNSEQKLSSSQPLSSAATQPEKKVSRTTVDIREPLLEVN